MNQEEFLQFTEYSYKKDQEIEEYKKQIAALKEEVESLRQELETMKEQYTEINTSCC